MSEAPSSSSIELSSADLTALQGCWEQVYLEVDGIPNPPDEHTAPDALTTINGKRFSVCRTTGELMLEGVFELNATTSPKSITWIDSFGPNWGALVEADISRDKRVIGDPLLSRAKGGGPPR